jgi:hypothetical protein
MANDGKADTVQLVPGIGMAAGYGQNLEPMHHARRILYDYLTFSVNKTIEIVVYRER